jgi:hypothetical protein
MDPVVVLPLALLLATLALALRLFRDGPSVLPNFFRHQLPGWPHGVQEDDDARWAWTRRPEPAKPALERVHGRVRPG